MTFRIYRGGVEIVAEGDSPLEITGLPQDTEYPEGMFEATRLENGRESERVDVPYFRTLCFADYEENDVDLTLTVHGEETTGTYTILGMPADKYVGGEHDENVVYAVQPDVAESGAVYFLGDEYVDKVVREGEVVYGENIISNGGFEDGTTKGWVMNDSITEIRTGTDYGNCLAFKHPAVGDTHKNRIYWDWKGWQKDKDYTLSFIAKAEKSVKVNTGFITNLQEITIGTEWAKYTLPLKFISFSAINFRILTANTNVFITHIKAELGSTATPYTVAPEDLFPSVETFPSFPEWPDEENEEERI